MSQFQKQYPQKQQQKQHHQQQHQQKRPCCKVCMDAGKSEKEYSSHWVKDTQGAVICPTLLGQKCRYCDRSGHTVKFCVELEKMTKYKEKCAREVVARDEYEMKQVKVGATVRNENKKGIAVVTGAASAIASNKWLALDDGDSDDDTAIKKKNVSKCNVDFPQLSLAPKMQQTILTPSSTPTPTSTWASKVASAAATAHQGQGLTTNFKKVEQQLLVPPVAAAVGVRNLEYRDASQAFASGLNWGKATSKNWEDLEEEQDEEEEEYEY